MEEFEIQFSQVASLLGEKARSVMLWNLLDGRAYTATELSLCADISPQAASNHLAKLVSANILAINKQGRHRYYTFNSPEVARAIESMASLMPLENAIKKTRAIPPALIHARTCYDHLAGKAGVALTDALLKTGFIRKADDKYAVTQRGSSWFAELGVDVNKLMQRKRSFAHPCMDWSERRNHLAGALGASLLDVMLKKDWLRRIKNSREILITPKGKLSLKDVLKIDL